MHRHVLLACLALAGCAGREASRDVTADSGGAPRVEPGSVPGAAMLELWQLRPGITLREWKAAHPDEAVTGSDTSAMSAQLGPWCAGVQRPAILGQRLLMRTAFFYPPDPDSTVALRDSAADLVLDCRLGLVWTRTEIPDSSAAAALADSLATLLAQAWGPAVAKPAQFYGAALWHRSARYHRGDVDAMAAVRRAAGPNGPWVVFAFAFLPAAGVSLDGDARAGYAPVDTMPFDSVLALAALDTGVSAPLRRVLRAADSTRDARPPRELIQPLQRWLAASQGLPLPRRAAALYAADRVLDRAMCRYGLCETAQRAAQAPLEAAGARFRADALGGGWVYQHSWEDQARILDRDSPLGQRILLHQMASGFDQSGVCAAGTEGFRRVIENGERYLARVPDSPIAADVHYQVGEAYADIVALAHGVAGDDADSSRYSAEAGPAALRALEHFRAALRAGPRAPAARAAWRRAWWMKAGLAPREVRFYCLYD